MTKDRRVKRISPLFTSPVLPGIGSAFKAVITADHGFLGRMAIIVTAGIPTLKR